MNVRVADIYASAVKLMPPLSTDETYAVIVSEAQKLAGAGNGSVFIDRNGVLERVYSSVGRTLQIKPSETDFIYGVFKTQKAKALNSKWIDKVHPGSSDTTAKKMIFIPVSCDEHSVGVLTLDANIHSIFSQRKLKLLQLFCSFASLKIKNNILIHELETALEKRDLFISMSSHELKTPLTTISAFGQLINKQLSQNKPINPEWGLTLHAATLRLTRLIAELLQVNQIRTGKMSYSLQETMLGDIIFKAVTDFEMSYPHHELIQQIEPQVMKLVILADGDKLVQVLINVLSNAAKFSPKDKPLVLQVSAKNKGITVVVNDEGAGIAPEHLDTLFDDFYNVERMHKEGLGLGLFISKKIIEAHRGTITITSQLNQGTKVLMYVPLALGS